MELLDAFNDAVNTDLLEKGLDDLVDIGCACRDLKSQCREVEEL